MLTSDHFSPVPPARPHSCIALSKQDASVWRGPTTDRAQPAHQNGTAHATKHKNTSPRTKKVLVRRRTAPCQLVFGLMKPQSPKMPRSRGTNSATSAHPTQTAEQCLRPQALQKPVQKTQEVTSHEEKEHRLFALQFAQNCDPKHDLLRNPRRLRISRKPLRDDGQRYSIQRPPNLWNWGRPCSDAAEAKQTQTEACPRALGSR